MADPESDLLRQVVDDHLTCAICLQTFDSELRKPKNLPVCRHIFCLECLKKYVEHKQVRMFECPHCRRQVKLSLKGVEGLPDDRTVLSLTDKVVLNKGGAKPKSKDEVKNNKDSIAPRGVDHDTCPKHQGEELRMYCNRCAVPVCTECVENEHDGHSTSGIKKIAEMSKENLNPLLGEGKWKMEELRGHLKGLQFAGQRLQESKEAATTHVKELGRTLKSEIDAIVANILGEIEARNEGNLHVIMKDKEDASRKLEELNKICSDVDTELKTSTPSRIVEKEQEMGDQLKQVVSQDVPVHESVITFEFKANRTKLSDLSFGEVRENVEIIDRKSFTNRVLSQIGGEGCMLHPGGVTTWEDEIYMVDRGNKQIQVFDRHGNKRRSFPTDVFENGSEPQDICVMFFENEIQVFVTDKCEQGLRIFDQYGKYIDKLSNVCTGPMGLTVCKQQGTLVVVDQDDNCVRMWPALNSCSPPENYHFSFNRPFGITTNMKGKIFLSDCQNHCIKVLSPKGEHLHTFGSEGGGEGQLRYPLGVQCDDQGQILVADSGNRRVEVFSEDGEFRCHAVTAEDGLGCPVGVALLPQGDVLVVTDNESHKLLFVRYSL
ncbi:PREDICTED: tripartite motif-containing protein 2-like [Branchiostoma belcheri]|uniref:RING-type E3 ubiquitin transferase n=1 Tax=Branchiostoma belcheri TaxID=7741 RepID=A0A6P4XV08_BRABE|nr:PREDICTED: tripartite motif-containing protein 2-like [Branchiostoma belcheri]